MAEGRLIDNIVHSSDDPSGAAYEFAIWYGHATHLLHPPPQPVNGEGP
jgi:nucleoside-diphosphate kinase